MKSRNFLTNISYKRLKQKNYDNQSFVIGSFSYILLRFNSINLDRKFFEIDGKEFINMLWLKCMPKELLDFISQKHYFKLYNLGFKYATPNDIVKQFTLGNPNHINLWIRYFQQHALKYQYVYSKLYVYSNLFPKYFSGVDNWFKMQIRIWLCI